MEDSVLIGFQRLNNHRHLLENLRSLMNRRASIEADMLASVKRLERAYVAANTELHTTIRGRIQEMKEDDAKLVRRDVSKALFARVKLILRIVILSSRWINFQSHTGPITIIKLFGIN